MFLPAQRALLALCFISLLGCSSPYCRQWEIQEITTRLPCFNSGRLLLEPDLDYSHLELELIRNRCGIRFYVNLLFLQASPSEEDPNRTQMEIIFEDQDPWIIYPYLLEGGQRFLLPGEIADTLIESLLNGSMFTLQMGRSRITVVPNNFCTAYQRLLALPIEEDISENSTFNE